MRLTSMWDVPSSSSMASWPNRRKAPDWKEIRSLLREVLRDQSAIVVTHDAGHKMLCYFHDPDGILLEITEYK